MILSDHDVAVVGMDARISRRVGVVGKDGRTDALAAKCAESTPRPRLFALSEVRIPGLVDRCADRVQVVADLRDVDEIARWADEIEPSLVIVGPEEPLEAGAVDALVARGIPCFGPTAELARIESSKTWARALVEQYRIPGNPAHWTLTAASDVAAHLVSVDEFVVKPDGLTGGKGVRVYPDHFESFDEAVRYSTACIQHDGIVLIEERLEGEEFSLQTITDGASVLHCPVVQDHKRAFEDDKGPNTGGMGSYSCPDFSLPFLERDEVRQAQKINELVIQAMRSKTGAPYRGVLYGGFMATGSGVRLIEYNCRFGDPEALNVLPIMTTDFVSMCLSVATGRFDPDSVKFEPKATVCKYIVPLDYPSGKGKGDSIVVPRHLFEDPNVHVFWAACDLSDTGVKMTGSRAVGIVGLGDTLAQAERFAQHAALQVEGPVTFRHDIGTAELVDGRIQHMNILRHASDPGRAKTPANRALTPRV